jgi:nitrite reductase/ring-hydroxylating ferredoxin subunit
MAVLVRQFHARATDRNVHLGSRLEGRHLMAESALRRDLTAGVPVAAVTNGGMLLGRVGDEDVLLTRSGDRCFAVGAHCTHYHGPLAEGLVVGATLRCPLHHACFSLETGEAVRAPALDPIPCWRVERVGDTLFVREKLPAPNGGPRDTRSHQQDPSSVVIVGGGAAGLAAADMLRREDYEGPITMISADQDPPVDRPNLSKDFLVQRRSTPGRRKMADQQR